VSNQFETIKEEAVIALKENFAREITNHPTFKAEDLLLELQSKLLGIHKDYWEREDYKNQKTWINEGYECELLSPGQKQWKKGKVRVKLTLEFCPNDPTDMLSESPLDDIRNSLQNNP
jgi:hypothetical protein